MVGALVGAAVALLIAPGPGRDTRKRLRRRMRAARERLGVRVEDLGERLGNLESAARRELRGRGG